MDHGSTNASHETDSPTSYTRRIFHMNCVNQLLLLHSRVTAVVALVALRGDGEPYPVGSVLRRYERG